MALLSRCMGMNGIHTSTPREAIVGRLAGRASGRSALRRGGKYVHGGRAAVLRVLRVQQQLGAEVASRWSVA